MAEPGTETARPEAWGPKLNSDWWFRTSDALLRRLIGYGGGDGPPQDQTTRLSQGVQIIFRANESDDLGERSVRAFLSSDQESTDTLYLTLCDVLVERCGPLLRRQIAETDGAADDRAASASAAIMGRPPSAAPYAGSGQTGSEVRRPTPKKRRPEDRADWWESYIDKQNANFDREYENRLIIYQTFLEALEDPQREQFADIAEVLPAPERWQPLFKRALSIAQMAIGIPRDENDDAYHYASVAPLPAAGLGNLRSFWLLGELVHAQWQFEYMHAEPYNDILAEYLFTRGAARKAPNPLRGPLRDYRKIRRNKEEPDQFGAAQWAFGEWRPDLIDFGKNEIFEIKPLRTAHYGVLQLWRYTHNYNCARFFDWLTKPGAQGKAPPDPLRLGRVSKDHFREVDPTTFLEEYFRARDDDNEGGAGKPRIPKQRQRARRSEVEGVIRAKGKIKVLPMLAPGVPGLVLYIVQGEKRNGGESVLPTPGALVKVVLVVAGLLVITTVLFGVVMAAAAVAEGTATSQLAAATGAAVVARTLASQPVMASAEEPVIEVFGMAMDNKTVEAATTTISDTFDTLNAAGVL